MNHTQKQPDYNKYVKIGSGPTHNGAWHRAIEVAKNLFKAGRWDGQSTIIIEDPYEAHYTASVSWKGLHLLEEGKDYRILPNRK